MSVRARAFYELEKLWFQAKAESVHPFRPTGTDPEPSSPA